MHLKLEQLFGNTMYFSILYTQQYKYGTQVKLTSLKDQHHSDIQLNCVP